MIVNFLYLLVGLSIFFMLAISWHVAREIVITLRSIRYVTDQIKDIRHDIYKLKDSIKIGLREKTIELLSSIFTRKEVKE